MRRLARGDAAPLGELFVRYGKMVACVVSAYLARPDRAERDDLCQEVFLTLMDIAPRYHEQDKLPSLLRGIAVRKAKGLSRRRWVRRALLGRFAPDSGRAAAYESAIDTATADRQRLSRLLEKLPPAQREVVVLRFVEEMDDEQIAETLGISRTTVSTRLFRARQVLGRYDDDGSGGAS